MKLTLKHVQINVSDLERAVKWYEKMLDFKASSMWPPEKPEYADFETGGQVTFALAKGTPYPSGARCNFYVEDVELCWKKLKDRAVILESLHNTPYGLRRFSIKDPDGNELGFVQDDSL
ncbi:VOC family protein [Salibacterium aidingense]|uniref:VOC family protein n=1 Tax=Salibacterium aidingense TaxID=384933 RepID=UPI0003FCEBB3|nr:VOC family protein [Salibacterium aidingense]